MYGRRKKPNKVKVQKQPKEDNIIKTARNLFKLNNENQAIKSRLIRDIRNVFRKDG